MFQVIQRQKAKRLEGIIMKLETRLGKNYATLNFSLNLPFNKCFRFNVTIYDKPNAYTLGYNNRTKDGKFVIFMDFDDLNKDEVCQELRFLQGKFKLSDFYLFKLGRENSYHSVCLDKVTMRECWDILQISSCDGAFINSIKNLRTRFWVLRIANKGSRGAPIYEQTLKSKYKQRIKSNAHAMFLKKYWKIKVRRIGKWDKETELGVIKYNTSNRTKN
jgi:hypothetical protein